MQKRVLIAEPVEDICIKTLTTNGIYVEQGPITSLQGHHGLIVRSATKVTKDIIERTDGLEIIGRAGAGVDTIDVQAATQKGIVVCNTPYANSISVAELVFGFMLNHARSMPAYDAAVKLGEWPKGKLPGKSELAGKTLGIIGLGNIGKEVAKRAEAFGMQIIYVDPYVTMPNYQRLPVQEIFSTADIVTVHVPAMKETEGMVTLEHLLVMKDHALFINTARPQVLVPGVLEQALDKRPDLLAALDVHDVEKAGPKPLGRFSDRILLTPHIGASTREAQQRAAKQVAEQFVDYFQSGKIRHAVNFSSIPDELYPFLDLAEKITRLGTILLEECPTKIEYTCYGALASHGQLFERAMVCGVLRSISDASVTYINAPLLARQTGLSLVQRDPMSGKAYGDSLTIDVVGTERVSIRGHINEEKDPRIVRINDFCHKVDLVPAGQKVVLMYDDKKGVIGAVGDVCEKNGLNIDHFFVTPDKKAGTALAIFETEGKMNDICIEEIRQTLQTKGISVYRAKAIWF
ncbi:hypothetical protein HY639_05590 [Candidatus Woesearchaeota archaeon]|nr:hypothetical protein [Candidatus Woesearchaeota archaeon]